MVKRLAWLLLLLIPCVIWGQSTAATNQHKYWIGTVPSSAAVLTAGTVYLEHASFSTGNGSGTITLTDRSGACTGGADCAFLDGVAIAANTSYEADFHDAVAPSGLKLSATGTVAAHIHWDTQVLP